MTVHIQSSWIKMLCTFFGRKILVFFALLIPTITELLNRVLLLTLTTSIVTHIYYLYCY